MIQTEPSDPQSVTHRMTWVASGLVLVVCFLPVVLVRSFTLELIPTHQLIALTLTSMLSGAVYLVIVWRLFKHDAARPRSTGFQPVSSAGQKHQTTSSPISRSLLAWIFIVGLILRGVASSQPPAFETDYFRFMWDGAVTAHGINPYTVRPVDVLENRDVRLTADPSFAQLVEQARPTLQQVNHPHLTTIYPPVAQGFFALAYKISPFDPNALRGLFLATELGIFTLLLTMLRRLGRPAWWVLIYWWNPLAVKEFYVGVHMDALAALLALGAVGAVMSCRRRTGVVLLGLAVGVKLWPIVLAPLLLRYGAKSGVRFFGATGMLAVLCAAMIWPLLASWGHGSQSGVTAYATYWISNAGFMSVVDWLTRVLQGIDINTNYTAYPAARLVVALVVVAWMLFLLTRRLPDARSLVRWSMIAVGGLFVLSPTQFPWYYTWVLPLLALAPSRGLLLYTALLPLYHLQYRYPWVLWVEHVPVWLLIIWDTLRDRSTTSPVRSDLFNDDDITPPASVRVSVIIPALNEQDAIGKVISAIPKWVTQVIVADNGSTDATASVALSCGATVVPVPRRGYGQACLAGMDALDRPDVVVFMDGDFSDRPAEMGRLISPIVRDEADLVIGSRVLGNADPGSLTPQQRFGNALACRLMRLLYGARHTDLGPFRAVRAASLARLNMDDRNFGWTVQMQVRAARQGLRVVEVPVSYRKRIGTSKISGTVRGVVLAGTKILSTIFREGLRPSPVLSSTRRVIVFARYPQAGRCKTRLVPLLGAVGAALLHRQLVHQTLHTVRALRHRRDVVLEVRHTGATDSDMAGVFGHDVLYHDQLDGDLGARLHRAAADARRAGATHVVLIGTDCPRLTPAHLDEAFDALDHHDVVLGPATDGGYYLIGLTTDAPLLFQNISWGGPEVLTQTMQACDRIGLRYTLLEPLSDIDTPADLATWGRERLVPANRSPRVSVVIPARDEQDHLAATLASVLQARDVEVLLVDGASTDRTADIARAFGVTVLPCAPSRGVQLNLGAKRSRGPVLLFVHADTLLPSAYLGEVFQTLCRPGVVAGAFSLRIDARGVAPRLIDFGVQLRSRLMQRPYGDQAMFMSREVFENAGSFPPLSCMEDYAMLDRLHALGAVRTSHRPVLTSARRWRAHGWMRVTLKHQWMILRHQLSRDRV